MEAIEAEEQSLQERAEAGLRVLTQRRARAGVDGGSTSYEGGTQREKLRQEVLQQQQQQQRQKEEEPVLQQQQQ